MRQASSQALIVSRIVSGGSIRAWTGAPRGLGKPDLRPQQRRQIAGEQQQRRERAAPVAQAHPALADAAAPAEPVPAGKRDSAEPARLLADRGAEASTGNDRGSRPRRGRPAGPGSRTNMVFRPSAPSAGPIS